MADVLIRMEMPETCGQCPIFNYDYNICNFLSTHHHEYETSRIDGCPLHELPKHGDLIDRDALKHKFCAHCDGYENDTGACVDGDQDCMDAKIIMTAPVIVPSNKEETE